MSTIASPHPVLVVAGIGNGSGTGAATARLFSKHGYSIALIARGADSLKNLADEIDNAGGNAAPFPIASYTHEALSTAFASIREHFPAPTYSIRGAVYNAGHVVWKPFLDINPQDIQDSLEANVTGAFAFAREAILSFKDNKVYEGEGAGKGSRGTLVFTGATASLRGNTTTSAFAAGKFGMRALSQSLAKEFGKENIHVAHAIVDGHILTDRQRTFHNDPSWEQNANLRSNPEDIAASYLYLVNQAQSAWTWELDLRPAHEKW